MSRDGWERRSVKLGAGNDEWVQVVEGLAGVEDVMDHARPYGDRDEKRPKAAGERPCLAWGCLLAGAKFHKSVFLNPWIEPVIELVEPFLPIRRHQCLLHA